MTELIKNKNTDKAEVRCEETMKLLGWMDKIETKHDFLEFIITTMPQDCASVECHSYPTIGIDFDIFKIAVHRKPFYYFTCKEKDFNRFYKTQKGE